MWISPGWSKELYLNFPNREYGTEFRKVMQDFLINSSSFFCRLRSGALVRTHGSAERQARARWEDYWYGSSFLSCFSPKSKIYHSNKLAGLKGLRLREDKP